MQFTSALRIWAFAASLAVLPLAAAAEALVLMMVEQPGCIYCLRWDAEIAPKYELTDEGRRAPLQRQQLRAALPEGVTFDRPAIFTPTFVLLRDGVEAGRIEGYPGEDFFWGLLGQMLDRTAP
ncbi:MAG: thioredoxin family protein [Gemmobacter sp.]